MFNRYKTRIMKLEAQLREREDDIDNLTRDLSLGRESREMLSQRLKDTDALLVRTLKENNELKSKIDELKPEHILVHELRELTQELKNKG